MCGIIVVINWNGISSEDLNYFEQIMRASEVRGDDATGVCLQNLASIKAPMKAREFLELPQWKTFREKYHDYKWIIGHVRNASQGDPSDNNNNHPVSLMPLKYLLMHNGIVHTNKFDENSTLTDTYIIAEAIKRNWIEGNLAETIEKAYLEFYGYAAIIVSTQKQLNLTAKDNPIVYGKMSNGSHIFASEKEFFPENTSDIYKFNNDGESWTFREDGTKEVRTVKMIEPEYKTILHNWDDSFIDDLNSSTQTSLADKPVKVKTYFKGSYYPHKHENAEERARRIKNESRKKPYDYKRFAEQDEFE